MKTQYAWMFTVLILNWVKRGDSYFVLMLSHTAQKKKFSIKDFFSENMQFHSFLQIWSYLLKKPLMENFIFCAVSTKEASFFSLMFLNLIKNGSLIASCSFIPCWITWWLLKNTIQVPRWPSNFVPENKTKFKDFSGEI